MKKIAMGLVFFIMAASCGDSVPSYDKSLNGNPLEFLEKGDLALTENDANGSGKFVFSNPLSGDHSFEFLVHLEDNSSSVTVVTNADNKLEKGLSIIFFREEEELKVTVKLGTDEHHIDEKFNSLKDSDPLYASKPHSFVIDVHAEDPAHVLIWKKQDSYTIDNVLFNSEEKESGQIKKYPMGSKVTGKFWGFDLTKSKISNPKVDKPKHSHHH